jgi:hypothetical protein
MCGDCRHRGRAWEDPAEPPCRRYPDEERLAAARRRCGGQEWEQRATWLHEAGRPMPEDAAERERDLRSALSEARALCDAYAAAFRGATEAAAKLRQRAVKAEAERDKARAELRVLRINMRSGMRAKQQRIDALTNDRNAREAEAENTRLRHVLTTIAERAEEFATDLNTGLTGWNEPLQMIAETGRRARRALTPQAEARD